MLPVVLPAVSVSIVAVIAAPVTPVSPAIATPSGVVTLVAAPVTIVSCVMAARAGAMTPAVLVDVLAMATRLRLGSRRHRRETAHGQRHGNGCNQLLHRLRSSACFQWRRLNALPYDPMLKRLFTCPQDLDLGSPSPSPNAQRR
jgi:hypothetical protein